MSLLILAWLLEGLGRGQLGIIGRVLFSSSILDPFMFDTAINPRSTCKGPWERTIRDHWMGVVLGFHSDPFVFGVVIDPRSTLSARLFRFKGQEAKINVYSPHILWSMMMKHAIFEAHYTAYTSHPFVSNNRSKFLTPRKTLETKQKRMRGCGVMQIWVKSCF